MFESLEIRMYTAFLVILVIGAISEKIIGALGYGKIAKRIEIATYLFIVVCAIAVFARLFIVILGFLTLIQ